MTMMMMTEEELPEGSVQETPLVARGLVQDWDRFESVLSRCSSLLPQCPLDETPLCIAQRPNTPRDDREKLSQIVFESFCSPAMLLMDRAVASLFSTGRTIGMSLHVGHDITWLVPVVDGHAVTWASHILDVGCEQLFLRFLSLTGSRHSDIVPEHRPLLRSIFHEVAYKVHEVQSRSYTLPDGSALCVGDEGRKAVESLFDFESLDYQYHCRDALLRNIMEVIHQPLNNWSLLAYQDNRAHGCTMWKAVCLSGGGGLISDFGARLEKEMRPYDHHFGGLGGDQQARILTEFGVPARDHAWTGCSIVASLSTAHQWSVTKDMYDEEGPNIVNRVCY